MSLAEDASAQLARWGLTDADAERAGLFTVPSVKALYPDMPDAPAIVIPYFGPDGAPKTYRDASGRCCPFARVRWLVTMQTAAQAFLKPKPQRYGQPPKSGVAAYFPLTVDWGSIVGNPARPIVVTEGEAKALCAAKHGVPAVALGGVHSFMARSQDGILPELEAVSWRDRDVYIVFDSDAVSNPQVMAAEGRLADELQRGRGAKVRIVRLPPGEGKVGLDDYLTEHGFDAFARLCGAANAVNALDVKVLRLNASCAWIEGEGAVYDIDQKRVIQKTNFTCGSHHSSHTHTVATARAVKAVNVAQIWLTHPLAQRFSEILFRPGEPRTVPCEGGTALNIWDGFQNPEEGDVGPFLELSEHLFQNMPVDQQDLPLKLIAYKARNPELKIPLSLVMVGPGGSGKSLWGEILVEAFEAYGRSVSAEQMVGKFNGWTERCLLAVVDEADAVTIQTNKEKIRAMISQLRIMMEEKFRPQREINCYATFIFNSNKRAVGSYGFDDRRMIVADIPAKREPEFYARVKAWRKAGGARHLMGWLLASDLGDWTPPSSAPSSAEKVIAYAEGLSPVEKLADEMRHSDQNAILQWIAAAAAWAAQAELSPNADVASRARVFTQHLPKFHIRPFYTAAEICMLFPLLQAQAGGKVRGELSPGEVSRALREAGIPYLKSADRPDGFLVRGRLQQFLVISDFERWSQPLTQAEFEEANANWPTFADVRSRA